MGKKKIEGWMVKEVFSTVKSGITSAENASSDYAKVFGVDAEELYELVRKHIDKEL